MVLHILFVCKSLINHLHLNKELKEIFGCQTVCFLNVHPQTLILGKMDKIK